MSEAQGLEPRIVRRKRQFSQIELEQALIETQEELEKLTDGFEEVVKAEARARAKFKVSHAKAYLRSTETNAPGRSAYADCVTEAEMQEAFLGEAMVKYSQEAMRTKRNELEMLRSLNSNIRDQVVNR